jgi:hypothetical protein
VLELSRPKVELSIPELSIPELMVSPLEVTG